MNRHVFLIGFILVLAMGGVGAVYADPPITIRLNFPASDGMTVTDCLKAVALETGVVILPDSSVTGYVGDIHVTATSIPDALTALQTYEPGLTWQTIYYPGSGNEPSGEDLYKAIQELKTSNIDGLVIPPSGDDKLMLSFKKQLYTTPAQEAAAESGFQQYYLVSDPTVRATMAKIQTPASKNPATPTDKVAHFAATLSDLESQLAQMNQQQQIAALTELSNVSKQMMQSAGQGASSTVAK